MTVPGPGGENARTPEPWTSLLWDPRPVQHAFSGTAPDLADVVIRGLTLERRASGPLALVTLQWPCVPVGAPRKWATADSLKVRLAFHSVAGLRVSGWPSEERASLVLSREDDGVAADISGHRIRLSLRAALVGVDGFEATSR